MLNSEAQIRDLSKTASRALGTTLVVLALAAGYRALTQDVGRVAAISPATIPAIGNAEDGLLSGRVTTEDGAIYEGRLRFGGDEEAFWGHYFNGVKKENSWAAQVPRDRLPTVRDSIEVFGVKVAAWDRRMDLGRPFMARFGDIARIEASGRNLRVILRSGTVFDLDRFAADDFADGIRVWDGRRGVVDLDEWRIRTIEFLPTARTGAGPYPLYGTVRTRQGDFTGFVQWDREACVGDDELNGRTADREVSLRFDAIRSITHRTSGSAVVTLLDGGEVVLSDTRRDGRGNRGLYVDDRRYGRVLVSWKAFERVDFNLGGPGPAYADFPPGRSLTGSVTTRSGRRLAGRLVYDLDESETTETLDAPSQGVDYTIPFGLIASIEPILLEHGGAQVARVMLHSGEELHLERTGDLGEGNAGMLIFAGGRERPEYVSWTEVRQVHFDRPPEMYPPRGPR
jgi:hypothetical protein